jgi:hypothetical protein
MVREQRNELLSNHPGRAKYSNLNRHRFFLCVLCSPCVLCAFLPPVIKKKADAAFGPVGSMVALL